MMAFESWLFHNLTKASYCTKWDKSHSPALPILYTIVRVESAELVRTLLGPLIRTDPIEICAYLEKDPLKVWVEGDDRNPVVHGRTPTPVRLLDGTILNYVSPEGENAYRLYAFQWDPADLRWKRVGPETIECLQLLYLSTA